jgi:hypothetical protein
VLGESIIFKKFFQTFNFSQKSFPIIICVARKKRKRKIRQALSFESFDPPDVGSLSRPFFGAEFRFGHQKATRHARRAALTEFNV